MTSEHYSSASETLPFARSDASRTAVRGVLFDRLEGFLAMIDLLRKGQVLFHFSGTYVSHRNSEPQGLQELELFGTRHFSHRLFFDDSSSTAIVETEWPSVLHVKDQAHELRDWFCLPSGPRTSISGFLSFIPADALTGLATGTLSNLEIGIDPEAQRRLKGYEGVARTVCEIASDLSKRQGLLLTRIRVRPAWSHEYEEESGVVIDIDLKGSSEERFSYWEVLSREVDTLARSLPVNEFAFLNADVSVIVSRR